jgi:CBS domain-containing protein
MKVREVMSVAPSSCTPEMDLGAAVEILWSRNCGILPVVNNEGRVISVITDRDICIALGTRNRLPGELTVGDVTKRGVISCTADEDVCSALTKMAERRVRRLPVVNAQGKLEGILSMDDIVEQTQTKTLIPGNDLSSEFVVSSLKRLYAAPIPQIADKAASRLKRPSLAK